VWPGGVMVRALDLRLNGRRSEARPFRFPGNNLGQVVHTHVPLSPSSIIWCGGAVRLGR